MQGLGRGKPPALVVLVIVGKKGLGYNAGNPSAREKHRTISKIETRKAIPTDRLIKTICGIFLVNEDWLRTGHGQMYLQVKYGYEFAEVYDKLCPEMKELAIKIIKDILETQKNNRQNKIWEIKVKDYIN